MRFTTGWFLLTILTLLSETDPLGQVKTNDTGPTTRDFAIFTALDRELGSYFFPLPSA